MVIYIAGYVRKRNGKWYYTINLGYVDGKRKRIERAGGDSKKEAELALSKALVEYNQTGNIPMHKIKQRTLYSLFEEWLATESVNRKETTLIRYRSLYSNHLTVFDDVTINTISNTQIQKMLNEKYITLSTAYVNSLYNFMQLLFKFAIKKKYIKDNPMDEIILKKDKINTLEKIEFDTYSKDDMDALLNRASKTNIYTPLMLGIHLGVRAGECYALQWSDIDFDKNLIRITKQLQYINKKWSFTTLKTQNSYRTISFGQVLKNYLLELYDEQKKNKIFLGDYYKNNLVFDTITNKTMNIDDFICVKKDGEMLNTNSHRTLSRIVKNENLLSGKDFKFHNLRHTHATILLEQGINPKAIQERLGHAKLDFTLRLYTHITRKMEIDTANSLDTFFK